MKTINHNQNRPYVSLKLGKRKSQVIAIFMSVAILNLSTSCSYYNVRNVPIEENISEQIKTFNATGNYVILHSNEISWHLNDMVINEDEQSISGSIATIDANHQYKRSRDSKRVHQYNSNKTKPLNEIHFYLKSPASFKGNSVNIPLSDIARISVNDRNTGRAIANIALTTVGVIFVALIIVAATKSSCPFVYVKNGEEFDFVGELYPGIITANMQQDNFLPLPNISGTTNDYILKVTNQLKEIQFTDQLQLLLVNHSNDIEVLLDSKGQIQTFQQIETPAKVTLDGELGEITVALKKDNEFYAFNTSKITKNSTRNAVFEFDRPKSDENAKLYITAKNSVWLDYIFGKFNEQFGSYYNTFQKNQQKIQADSIRSWSNGQNIPLSVYVKTDNEWLLVERINAVGPMAMRDIVVPIQLDKVVGNKLQVKLETGFMFWELDYVGVDFTKNMDLQMEYINPSVAIDQYGNNVTDLLAEADQKYFAQPKIGDEVVVHFPVKESIGDLTQSYFLKNSGYYNYIRDYKGIPDIENLKSFREDNTFTKYSEKAYFDFANFDLNTLSYHE